MATTLTASNLKPAGVATGIRGILWFLFPLLAVPLAILVALCGVGGLSRGV